MGVRRRLRIGVFALVLLSTVVFVPASKANKDPCEVCGATCIMTYQPGWSDCGGDPGGCTRLTICP
jgi:hypothetical protein